MRTILEFVLGASLISANMLTAEAVLTPVSPLLAGIVMLIFMAGGVLCAVMSLAREVEAA